MYDDVKSQMFTSENMISRQQLKHTIGSIILRSFYYTQLVVQRMIIFKLDKKRLAERR